MQPNNRQTHPTRQKPYFSLLLLFLKFFFFVCVCVCVRLFIFWTKKMARCYVTTFSPAAGLLRSKPRTKIVAKWLIFFSRLFRFSSRFNQFSPREPSWICSVANRCQIHQIRRLWLDVSLTKFSYFLLVKIQLRLWLVVNSFQKFQNHKFLIWFYKNCQSWLVCNKLASPCHFPILSLEIHHTKFWYFHLNKLQKKPQFVVDET